MRDGEAEESRSRTLKTSSTNSGTVVVELYVADVYSSPQPPLVNRSTRRTTTVEQPPEKPHQQQARRSSRKDEKNWNRRPDPNWSRSQEPRERRNTIADLQQAAGRPTRYNQRHEMRSRDTTKETEAHSEKINYKPNEAAISATFIDLVEHHYQMVIVVASLSIDRDFSLCS